ncbi:MAG: protoporphyrinogen oxidase HemJ [Gammaproteobacteria bacterium]
MVTWFAGLFYLPRLFVYHAQANDDISLTRFKVMEARLYYAIMTPAGILTTIFGLWLLGLTASITMKAGWMHAKLTLVILLWAYHLYCGVLVKKFKQGSNHHSHKFYRWFNEFPTLILVTVVILVVVKPG